MIKVRSNPRNAAEWDNLAHIKQEYRQGIRRGWLELGKALKKEARDEITHGRKTGNVYRVRSRTGKTTRRHQASAPGESHANVTHTLRDSIGWKVLGFSRREFGYGVTGRPTPKYAPFVEYGTFGSAGRSGGRSSRMMPRPTLKNAIDAREREGFQDFVKYIGRNLD